MVNIKIKRERDNSKLPIKGSKHAACYDVFCSDILIKEDGMVICRLGFSTEIPEGWMGVIVPRSSITKTGWVLANSYGVIDSDYRGEWQARFRPIPREEFQWNEDKTAMFNVIKQPKISEFLNVGSKVAQIYFQKVNKINFEEVVAITETERGKGGFGSTGVK